jgi:hypothetical protein
MVDPDPEVVAALDEVGRQRRLVDQMSTMHSLVRDQARLQGTALLCVVLVASVVALAFAFAGGSPLVNLFGVEAARSTWLGWLAVVTFSLTLIDLVLDRRGAAGQHDDAVRQLSMLKSEYRTPPSAATAVDERRRLSERYQAVMDALPPIPERSFLRLKARHLEKVEVSRYLSDHAGMSARRARKAVRQSSATP